METIVDLERRLGLVYREVTLSTGSVIEICDASPEQSEAIGQWWDAYDAAARFEAWERKLCGEQ